MTAELVEESRRLEGLLGVPPLVRVNGKRPLDRDWTNGPRTQPSEWRRRLRAHDGNVGLLTGEHLVVIDVDLYHHGAEDSLDALHDLGLPRETVTAITGGGGRHLYYSSATPIPSRPLEGYPGIDVKAEGGQVIVPPSIHQSGTAYEWEYGWAPGDVELAALPEHLVELLGTGGHHADGDLDERDEAAVSLLLDHFGGHSPHIREGYVEVTRPGKEARLGGSATVGAVGRGVVRVWSTHWNGLDAGTYGLTELRRLAGVEGPKIGTSLRGIEPPAGYRWWRPGDAEQPTPTLGQDAYLGPVGEYMAHVSEHSEAHPAGVGITVLAYLGAWFGRSVVYVGGRAIRHHPAIWGALVGHTASGAKGVAADVAELLLEHIDDTMVRQHSISGIGSGPGLIDRLQPVEEGKPAREVVVHEHELSSVLKVSAREGETLSETLRKAYDLKPLGSITRRYGDQTVEGYFMAALGSITPIELRSLLTEVAVGNGSANRWLPLYTTITRPMSRGDTIDLEVVSAVAEVAIKAMSAVSAAGGVEYRITDNLGATWDPFYDERRPGLRGEGPVVESYSSRHPAHAARIASVFAAIEGSDHLGLDHIKAGIAWCDYSLDTVRYVFGAGAIGDAGKLLTAIRESMPNGLTGTDQRDVFSRNRSGDDLDALRADLESRHLIHTIEEPTATRPRLRSFALTPTT